MSEKETRRVRKGAYANGSGSRAQRRAAAQRGRLHIEWIRAEEKDESSSAKQRAPRSRAQQRAEERRKRQGKVVLALAAAIVVLLALCGWQFAEYKGFQSMRAAVEIDTFFDGTTVEGIDVSQMTLEQALAHWQQNVESAYSGRYVTLSDGTRVTAAEVGYSSNYADVLKAAYEAGRQGGFGDRVDTMSTMENGVEFVVSRTLYTPEGIAEYVDARGDEIDCLPVDPEMTGFDAENYEFIFSEGSAGRKLDREALRADLTSAFENGGGGEVEMHVEVTPCVAPTGKYGIIATYSTDADSSTGSRIHNIRLAMQTINGTCLQPGEMFSFNGVVGERTDERGYRQAKAYYGMQDILEYGGGICQVSSTLYAAVQDAHLEVNERHEHSRRVYYIPDGRDATVDWGHLDLKFTNNRDEPIYIGCFVDDEWQCHVAIFGKLEEGDYGKSSIGSLT
ncbi:MAG TPA: VanW family protein [Candidatus Pullichristensenella avicola]|nr:VanW family protein [Candidatus Pullichristensenella avicola]